MAHSAAEPAQEALSSASVDPEEIAKFTAMAEQWWDPDGDFKPLHKLNPLRLTYIRDQACRHFNRDSTDLRPLQGLKLLDIGCGGGLLCEPMARLGAQVTGIDAAARNVGIAALHAEQSGLEIDYRHAAAEDLASAEEQFDLVLNMEVVEHVADVPAFIEASAALLKPGGMTVLSTLNRTAKSYLMAIVGAEYVLRWLPKGTHEWRKFLKPSELAGALRGAGLEVRELTGAAYNPIGDSWHLAANDLDVNYMAMAVKTSA